MEAREHHRSRAAGKLVGAVLERGDLGAGERAAGWGPWARVHPSPQATGKGHGDGDSHCATSVCVCMCAHVCACTHVNVCASKGGMWLLP